MVIWSLVVMQEWNIGRACAALWINAKNKRTKGRDNFGENNDMQDCHSSIRGIAILTDE
jgi:hypothetical protein